MPRGSRRTKFQKARAPEAEEILEERQIAPHFGSKSKKNDALFVIDKSRKATPLLSRVERKRNAEKSVLEMDRLINLGTYAKTMVGNKLPPNIIRPNPIPNEVQERRLALKREIEEKKVQKLIELKKQEREKAKTAPQKKKGGDVSYDLWDAPKPAELPDFFSKTYEPPHKSRVRHPRTVHDKLEMPGHGMSYRPEEEEHKDHLRKAIALEVNRRVKHDALMEKITVPEHLMNQPPSLVVDVPYETKSQRTNNLDEFLEAYIKNGMVVNPRVTAPDPTRVLLKLRRKAMRQRALNRIEAAKRADKKKHEQIEKVPEYLEAIEKREKILAFKAKRRARARKITKKFAKPRYFNKLDPDYYLTSEIPDSLRKVRQTQNTFDTLLNHFQKRRLIQTRLPSEEEKDPKAPKYKYKSSGSWVNRKCA
eukprot:TRINITY_DN286_c1_g1_i1.p1 TRINITY_DN286_c1_g1~~TRINITY_DN286_c1_g1_i1.p1  ORF type:complete len:440 (-),score=187.59 TRINITY_DN286_c1_g1_i1:238-1503(-)